MSVQGNDSDRREELAGSGGLVALSAGPVDFSERNRRFTPWKGSAR